jgi:hypothetical protein
VAYSLAGHIPLLTFPLVLYRVTATAYRGTTKRLLSCRKVSLGFRLKTAGRRHWTDKNTRFA